MSDPKYTEKHRNVAKALILQLKADCSLSLADWTFERFEFSAEGVLAWAGETYDEDYLDNETDEQYKARRELAFGYVVGAMSLIREAVYNFVP